VRVMGALDVVVSNHGVRIDFSKFISFPPQFLKNQKILLVETG
jgi:hypothetical protein